MDSLRELFKVGNGPSSSHTIGPERASKLFKAKHKEINHFIVELYGSLALTGKGHLTDWIIEESLKPAKIEFVWSPDIVHSYHTNAMKFVAINDTGKEVDSWLVFSVGGGTIMEENQARQGASKVYKEKNMCEVKAWCMKEKKELWEYVEMNEGKEIWEFLKTIWNAMESSVERGINKSGVLPGTLKLPRRAQTFYRKARQNTSNSGFTGRIFAYTLAVSEENGGGGTVVTAPTCGAAGVIPGLLYALKEEYKLSVEETLKGLAVAGIIGNIIKENATISGAEGGCQAEVGSACAMASAMSCFLMGGSLDQIEYAAEVGLEHHLGLTCDPVGGYVQIPCIERNAVAATRALDSATYSLYTDGQHTITFDQVVETMKITGRDLKEEYRETSLGGLARLQTEC
ncbi:MAG: L-serine ammonia-lyase, iron-sulfur-dependent, subunit alpha [Fusobacteriaceae bacterium]